jgi:glutathione S-transferase
MKIYGHPMSTCTRKVLMTLAEKGQEAQLVTVDVFKGEQKSPENTARQPFGQIPSIDDDGFVLYESRAIARYLDEKLSGPKLTPADPKARAKMEQWISVETSNFTPIAMKLIYQLLFNKMAGKEADMKVVGEAKESIQKPLGILDKALEKDEFLAGPFSLAEVSFMPYVEYLYAAGEGGLVEAHPHVGSWWKRISNRPTWKKITGKN